MVTARIGAALLLVSFFHSSITLARRRSLASSIRTLVTARIAAAWISFWIKNCASRASFPGATLYSLGLMPKLCSRIAVVMAWVALPGGDMPIFLPLRALIVLIGEPSSVTT